MHRGDHGRDNLGLFQSIFVSNLSLANCWGLAYTREAQAILSYHGGLMTDLELKWIGIVLRYRGPDEFREASRWLSQHKPAKHFIQGIYLF